MRTTFFEYDGAARRLSSSSRIAEDEPAPLLIEAAVDAAQGTEGYRQLVLCVPPWLPKHLLREDRSFRSPGIFHLVRDLHLAAARLCERGTEVVMVGVPEVNFARKFSRDLCP